MLTAGSIDRSSRTRRRRRRVDLRAWRRLPAFDGDARFWVLVAWLAVVFLFGGSSRTDVWFLLFLRPLSVLVLAYALAGLTREQVREHRFLLGIAGAWLALALLQLVPLPPALWQALPGRQIIADIDRQFGLGEVWRPLSMAPDATRNAMWALLAPIAVIVLGIQLEERARLRLVLPVIILGFLSAAVGVLQMVGGPQGSLYFYQFSHNGLPVGLLANRNHQAALLACLLPVLAVWASMRKGDDRGPINIRRWSRWLPPFAGALILVPLILTTGSRSGLVLGIIALLSLPLLLTDWLPRGKDHRHGRTAGGLGRTGWLLVGGLGVLVVLTVVLGRALSFERIAGLDAGSDTRIRALPVVLALIRSYAPWGSGLGSFDQVYRLHEPDNLLSPFYLNHAHNDWLELALTGGLPAVLLLALSLAGLARSMIGLGAGHRHDRRAILLARVGLVIIVILGVASISDYPLRTPLLACLGATAVLWTQSGRARARRKEQARQRFDPVENLQPSSRLQGRPETHAFRNCR